jgi:exo-beta-1,3-glucanase (GH17 family)
MDSKEIKEYPKEIWCDETVGTNGYHCLDYQNYDDDVKYLRADTVESELTELKEKLRRHSKYTHTKVQQLTALREALERIKQIGKQSLCMDCNDADKCATIADNALKKQLAKEV